MNRFLRLLPYSSLRYTVLLLSPLFSTLCFPQIPHITSVDPSAEHIHSSVTIRGSGFLPGINPPKVFFQSILGEVTTFSDSLTVATVPSGASFGPLNVLTDSGHAESPLPFMTRFVIIGPVTAGSFIAASDVSTGDGPWGIVASDLDQDGRPDVVTANSSDGNLSILRNTSLEAGSLAFAPAVNLASGTFTRSIAASDLNNDGRPDLVAGNQGSNSLSIFQNRSVPGSLTASSFHERINMVLGNSIVSVAAADLNRDGIADLIAANSTLAGTILVLQGLGGDTLSSSSFSPAVTFNVGGFPRGISVADLDGDGWPDLAIANSSTSNISVLRNTAAGGPVTSASFESHVTFPAGAGVWHVVAADLNGDGRLDLSAVNSSAASVSVLKNQSTPGSVAFAQASTLAMGSLPVSLVAMNVNGDALPDLAAVSIQQNTIVVFVNASVSETISFSTPFTLATGRQPYGIVAADLNADGRPDLAAPNYADESMTLWENRVTLGARITTGADSVSFGSVHIGTIGSQASSLTNTGSADLEIDSLVIDHQSFGIAPFVGTIPPGESLWLNLSYNPDSTIVESSWALIYHSGEASPETIAVRGEGISSSIVVRKFVDVDGDPRTTGDQSPAGWGLSLYRDEVSEAALVADSSGGILRFEVTKRGEYIAVEADSGNGWYRIDGNGRREEVVEFNDSAAVLTFVNSMVDRKTVVGYEARWNLVSVPRESTSGVPAEIFPQAVSEAYEFTEGSGYQPVDTCVLGKGYWVKFPAAVFESVVGNPIVGLTVEVVEGWNLVGGISREVAVSEIVQNPPGIISSPFFGYQNGYRVTETFEPGKAHWVKISSAGSLTF